MRNYVQPGLVIDHTPANDTASGDPVAIGGATVGVANVDVAANTQATFSVYGVFELPKTAGALAQGDECYLTGAGNITDTASGNTRAGYVWADAGDGDATVLVKLDG